MATNADFDALIVRITTATNTLETDVATINAGSVDIGESVALAQQAATDAQSYATQAQDEVEQLLDLHPLLKGEYGEPVNFTTNPVLPLPQTLRTVMVSSINLRLVQLVLFLMAFRLL